MTFSKDSFESSRGEARKVQNSQDNLDLLELKEINFPSKKPVFVRKAGFRRPTEKGNFIKVSNREQERVLSPGSALSPTNPLLTKQNQIDDAELAFKYVLDKGDIEYSS